MTVPGRHKRWDIYKDHYLAMKTGSGYSYFNPIELNTGLLQYLLDSNRLTWGPRGMTIRDFPSMLCETTPENRSNENAYITITEVPGFDRLAHERDFFMNNTFAMDAIRTDTGERVTMRQNVDYVRRIGQLLMEGRQECELGVDTKYIIHDKTMTFQGSPCHIIGVPQFTSLMYKHPNYMKSISSTQYNFEQDYLDLYTTLTGTHVNTMADILMATDDFKKLNGHTVDAINQLNVDSHVKENLKAKLAQQLNDALKDNFDRPDVTVSYRFYVFGADFRPLIYSLHELTPKHLPILKRIQELIETRIPGTHGLLRPGETRFENFFNFCKYGDLFCVRSEYIHPAHRPLYYVHEYQRSMMFDEIIYTLTIPASTKFWNRVTFTYYIHKYRTVERKKPKNEPSQYNKLLSRGSTQQRRHRQQSGLTNNKTKRQTTSKNKSVVTHSILPGDKIVNCYLYHNHKTIIVLRRKNTFYLLLLKPILTTIDLTSNITYDEYYNCGQDRIYGIITDSPVFEVSEYKEIGPCRTKKEIRDECGGLFLMSFWGFPLIKQSLPDYEFLNTLYKRYVKRSFSATYSHVLLNKFNSYQADSISKPADLCKYKACTLEELRADHMHYYRKYIYHAGQTDEYTIIIDKYEHVINNVPYYKYVCWVYKTVHGSLTTNQTRNIMFIPGKDLLGIITFLKTLGTELYKDPQGPQPDMMLINFNTTELVDMLHIQIFPKTDNVNRYYPSLYSTNFNLSTETRGHPISNIISKLEVYPNYYNELTEVKCIFNVGTLSSL